MRRISTISTAAAALLFAANVSVSAQAPNFAGKWTRVDDPAAAQAGGGGGRGRGMGGGGLGVFNCGMECTITQDAKTLTINRTQPGREGGAPTTVTTTITLGGESKITTQGRGGEMVTTANAKWDGTKLVITSTRDMQGTPATATQTISMDGGNMVVETNAPGREGAPVTTKVTYKKG